jgi:hypothetical protein
MQAGRKISALFGSRAFARETIPDGQNIIPDTVPVRMDVYILIRNILTIEATHKLNSI